jgi:hypothetical protein
MAKNFCCWVIVAGSQPTAFRSRSAEELLPTLVQLQRTQPDVTMKWFERGRLWETPVEAQEALAAKRQGPRGRGRDWRPGGQHKDPKAEYDISRDEKRARFKRRLISGRVSRPVGDAGPHAPGAKPPARLRGKSQK